MTLTYKKLLRPTWRVIYPFLQKAKTKAATFNVPLDKLLRGGENGIRAAKYAELSGEFLRPSTSVLEGPHVKLLQLYEKIGDKIFEEDILQSTDYYKNALQCMQLTGSYFYDRPENIKTLAERFIAQYKGKNINLKPQPGQSDSNQPVWVRPIKYSSYYEVIDGNHRIARAIMRGDKTIPALIYEKEAVLTPLQQLLLDCLWINKQKWLYQPLDSPELKDEWTLIRRSADRWEMMKNFLIQHHLIPTSQNPLSFMDIGSSYGWFIKQAQDIGFKGFGMERDPFGMDVGFKVYGLNHEQIIHSDIIMGLEKLVKQHKTYDVVSCLSVLHHFALGKSSTSAEDFIRLLDGITNKVLFIDTGEEHEAAFQGTLKGWNPDFIQRWIKENTSFKEIIPLGIDQDRKPPFEGYYNRTFFACWR